MPPLVELVEWEEVGKPEDSGLVGSVCGFERPRAASAFSRCTDFEQKVVLLPWSIAQIRTEISESIKMQDMRIMAMKGHFPR